MGNGVRRFETKSKSIIFHRLACAAPIVDLAINAPERQSSTAANATINVILQRQAKIATGMFVDALTTWLKTHKMADESSHVPIGRSVSRVFGNFVSSTSEKSGDNAKSTSLVDTVLLDLLLPSHHPVVVKSDPHAWIDLVISARRDPGQLATQHQEAIMQSLLAHMPPKGSVSVPAWPSSKHPDISLYEYRTLASLKQPTMPSAL